MTTVVKYQVILLMEFIDRQNSEMEKVGKRERYKCIVAKRSSKKQQV